MLGFYRTRVGVLNLQTLQQNGHLILLNKNFDRHEQYEHNSTKEHVNNNIMTIQHNIIIIIITTKWLELDTQHQALYAPASWYTSDHDGTSTFNPLIPKPPTEVGGENP